MNRAILFRVHHDIISTRPWRNVEKVFFAEKQNTKIDDVEELFSFLMSCVFKASTIVEERCFEGFWEM
jgi:hypothetical protein